MTIFSNMEIYNILTDEWSLGAIIPTPRSGIGVSELNGKIYIFGGEIPGIFSNVEEYDPITNSWREMLNMPTARHGLAATTLNYEIYLIGGGTIAGIQPTSITEIFKLSQTNN